MEALIAFLSSLAPGEFSRQQKGTRVGQFQLGSGTLQPEGHARDESEGGNSVHFVLQFGILHS